jgi:hypothetical protein
MLIDKGAVVGEVVTLKLTSGEELVTKLVEEGVTHYKISKPLVLSMTQKGIGMVPYLFTVSPDKDIKINKSTVVIIEATDKEFADQYLQGTTGISLV